MAKSTKQRKVTIKGRLTADDIYHLNSISADMLSDMFEEPVDNIVNLPAHNGKVAVHIPASRRTVVITTEQRDQVALAIAYSTLNNMAAQYQMRFGNLIRLYALGFSDQQIQNSGANYHAILSRCTADMYSILN